MPNAGSLAGSSGDAGVEYRRAVAAYAVAHGLAAAPLLGFGVAAPEAFLKAVSLESDDPVDDIRLDFQGSLRVYIQAKRVLGRGRPFEEALRQWAKAANLGLDADKDHLTIVGGRLTSTIKTCQGVLNGLRMDIPPSLTAAQAEALSYMEAQFADLTPPQIMQALHCGYIHELNVEEEEVAGSREAILLLGRIVRGSPVEAWHALIAAMGEAARLRAGHNMAGWSKALKHAGVTFTGEGESTAAQIERTDRALKRYCDALLSGARQIDLRSLGAELPPIPITSCDAHLRVTNSSDKTQENHVVWALLRRGRVVLTGLPGSGKSAVLKVAAGELIALGEGWLPILVSLKDLQAGPREHGFRRRMLDCAVRDLSAADQRLVYSELERLLDEGRITLLLDGLDETYEKRGAVVADLDRFLQALPQSVEVVLSTRDVGYGQAATLGWPDLRVVSPSNIRPTIKGVLLHAAEFLSIGKPVDRQSWVSEREDWVNAVLAGSPKLSETPLFPILLTLLTIEYSLAALPASRAGILKMVVESVVKRREAKRGDPFTLGPLEGESAATAAVQIFETEAFELLRHGGVCPIGILRDRVANAIVGFWDLSPGHASVVAIEGVNFWDEAGFFVAAGAEQLVSPRVTLFAEVGAAMASMRLPEDEVAPWILSMVQGQSLEAVVLAAGLSPSNAERTAELAVETADRALLHAIGQARAQGAQVSPTILNRVAQRLTADAEAGKREGWRSWLLAVDLDQGFLNGALMLQALTVYPAAYQQVGRALLALKTQETESLLRRAAELRRIFEIERLPRLDSRGPEAPGVNIFALFDPSLDQTIVGVVDALLGHDDALPPLVLAYLERGKGSMRIHKRLLGLMVERGFGDEALALSAIGREQQLRLAANMFDGERPEPEDVLGFIARLGDAVSDRWRDRRLDELADFVETLDLNDFSSWSRGLGEHGQDVVALFAELGGFNRDVLASSAQTVKTRMASLEGHGASAFFSLFDLAQKRDVNAWECLSDRRAASELLLEMLTWGEGSAWAAASALWEAPLEPYYVAQLRELIRRVHSSSRHVRIAALTLCSIIDGPEPDAWIADPNPVLRAVAAELCPAVVDGAPSPVLAALLLDQDGTVRVRSIENVSKSGVSGLFRSFLSEVANGLDPGWTCFTCHTVNEPGGRVCDGPGCRISPPSPSKDARTLLEGSAVPARGVVLDFDAPKREGLPLTDDHTRPC